jgi:hypothetical protein
MMAKFVVRPFVSGLNGCLARHLQKMASSPQRGQSLYRDPEDGRFWERSHPQGELSRRRASSVEVSDRLWPRGGLYGAHMDERSWWGIAVWCYGYGRVAVPTGRAWPGVLIRRCIVLQGGHIRWHPPSKVPRSRPTARKGAGDFGRFEEQRARHGL